MQICSWIKTFFRDNKNQYLKYRKGSVYTKFGFNLQLQTNEKKSTNVTNVSKHVTMASSGRGEEDETIKMNIILLPVKTSRC